MGDRLAHAGCPHAQTAHASPAARLCRTHQDGRRAAGKRVARVPQGKPGKQEQHRQYPAATLRVRLLPARMAHRLTRARRFAWDHTNPWSQASVFFSLARLVIIGVFAKSSYRLPDAHHKEERKMASPKAFLYVAVPNATEVGAERTYCEVLRPLLSQATAGCNLEDIEILPTSRGAVEVVVYAATWRETGNGKQAILSHLERAGHTILLGLPPRGAV